MRQLPTIYLGEVEDMRVFEHETWHVFGCGIRVVVFVQFFVEDDGGTAFAFAHLGT